MTKTTELQDVMAAAYARLVIAGNKLRQRLQHGDTKTLQWEPCSRGLSAKLGRGHLILHLQPSTGHPGINYTSSMGRNSDDSYGGFLPGVDIEQAKLLVYGDFKRCTDAGYRAQHNAGMTTTSTCCSETLKGNTCLPGA